MDKQEVISLRDTLKCGNKNIPLRLHINNLYAIIDESFMTEFVIWNDDAAIIYVIKLPDPITDTNASNKAQAVCVKAFDYSIIEGMEISMLPLANLGEVIDSISATRPTRPIAEDYKALILKTLSTMLSSELKPDFMPSDMNKLIGSNLNTDDDYYHGKFAGSKDSLA